MRKDQVEDHDDDRRGDHRPRRGLADLQRIALGVVAVEGGHGGDDEGEETSLDERIDDRIELEVVKQPRNVVVGNHDTGENGDQPAAGDADQDAQNRQERKEEHRGDDFRQNEIRRGIDTHDLQRVDLLGNAHRADLGSDVRSDLAGKDERHDRRGELQNHRLARGVTDNVTRDEGRFEIDRHLQGDDRADKDRNNGRQSDGVQPERIHFVDDAATIDRELLGSREDLSHQDEILPDQGEEFRQHK